MSGAAPGEGRRAQRIVVKVGTRVLTCDEGRIALSHLFRIVEAAAAERRRGAEVLLVSSGAIGLGREALGLAETPIRLADRQACAAVGQSRLMGLYERGFQEHGMVSAQVLLTQADLSDRARYLDLRRTLQTLLERGAVPVINANDAVETSEIQMLDAGGLPVFGDNDKLSALVATKLAADRLVLLTDVSGLFDKDPRAHADAQRIARVEPGEEPDAVVGGVTSDAGRGGMQSKVWACRIAQRSGCEAVIASGRVPGALERAIRGDAGIGTWFPAAPGLDAKRRWVAFASEAKGTLHLDAGAVRAVQDRGASLLAAGVTRIDGAFAKGDVVELRGPDGEPIGRGMVHCDVVAAEAWRTGLAPAGTKPHHALVHRDQLVLEPT